jgi:hypothetical protein
MEPGQDTEDCIQSPYWAKAMIASYGRGGRLEGSLELVAFVSVQNCCNIGYRTLRIIHSFVADVQNWKSGTKGHALLT